VSFLGSRRKKAKRNKRIASEATDAQLRTLADNLGIAVAAISDFVVRKDGVRPIGMTYDKSKKEERSTS
jgi:hypothetical protein